MNNVEINLRYLLWQKKEIKREEWFGYLAEWAGCDILRAKALLNGARIHPDEVKNICMIHPDISEETLQFENFLDSHDDTIYQSNMRYLAHLIEHGKQKSEFAPFIGVSTVTTSNWLTGNKKPSKEHASKIKKYFDLDDNIDLEQDPIFLSTDPIGTRAQKEWVVKKINDVDNNIFKKYFSAIKRLLDDEET